MRVKTYAKYKPSGADWLGDVPEHWKPIRLKNIIELLTDFTANGSFASLAENVEYLSEGYSRLIRLTDLRSNLLEPGLWVSKVAHEYLKKSELYGGEILVASVGSVGAICRMPKVDYKATLAPNMYLVRFDSKLASNDFIFYFLNSSGPQSYIQLVATSTAVPKLNKDNVCNIALALPSLGEQDTIVSFLDSETAKIDALISKQEKLIELLKEKRQATISHAVTKGLDPTVPMKPSSVEWLGDVPRHWDVKPFSMCFDVVYRYPTYYDIPYESSGVAEIRGEALMQNGSITRLDDMRFISKEVSDRFPMTQLKAGDFVMSVRGTLGKIGLVTEEFVGANITANLLRLSPRRDFFDESFLLWQMLSRQYQEQLDINSSQTTIKTVTVPQLNQTRCTMPPKDEQRDISAYLNAETIKIDNLITKAEQAIALQKEHRTALISAAVTGKIDVRDAASELQKAA